MCVLSEEKHFTVAWFSTNLSIRPQCPLSSSYHRANALSFPQTLSPFTSKETSLIMYSPYYQAYKPPRPAGHDDFYRSLSQDNYRTIDNYGSLPRDKYRSSTANNFGSLPRDQYRSPTRDNFRSITRDNYRSTASNNFGSLSRDHYRSPNRDQFRSITRDVYRSPSYDSYVHPIYRAASRIPVRNAPTNWISLRKRVSFLTPNFCYVF